VPMSWPSIQHGGRGIRGAGPHRQIRTPKHDSAERIGNLVVPPVELHVREGCTFRNVDGADAAGAVSDLVDTLRGLYVPVGTTFTLRSDILCVAAWGVAHEIPSI
jgi:hypothetical protein